MLSCVQVGRLYDRKFVMSVTGAIVCGALVIINLILNWSGYLQSDDLAYAKAADGWLRHAPFLGHSHWAIRHVIVLPMAASFAIFGHSEAALVVPSVCYAFALLAMFGQIAYHLAGTTASLVLTSVLGTLPVIGVGASMVSTDLPEAFFVVGSAWAFYLAERNGARSLFFLSGVMAGFAVITRETAIALLVFYAVMFVAGRAWAWRDMAVVALGFLLIAGLDWLFLFLLSGDPMYRLHISMAGAQQDGPQMEGLFQKAPGLDRFGGLDAPRPLKPLTTLVFSQSYGLLFWLAVPLAAGMIMRGRSGSRYDARFFGTLALVWLVVLGYGLAPWLWIIPRYFVVCVVAAIPMAAALAAMMQSGRAAMAAGLVALLIGTNLALDMMATRDLTAGEHGLVSVAGHTTETIYTDPSTLLGAAWLLSIAGLRNRVAALPPPPGGLYFFNSQPRRALPADWPVKHPPSDWTRLSETKTGAKLTTPVVAWFHLRALLPSGVVSKLAPEPHVIALYRVPRVP